MFNKLIAVIDQEGDWESLSLPGVFKHLLNVTPSLPV